MSSDVKKWQMDAYYYGLYQTGVVAIDRILSAVACAGRGYHHTEGWTETVEPPPHLRGASYAEMIQNAADDAAIEFRALDDAVQSAPASPAASDVCEWVVECDLDGDGHYETQCEGGWELRHGKPRLDGYLFCPSCGKPILFKESE